MWIWMVACSVNFDVIWWYLLGCYQPNSVQEWGAVVLWSYSSVTLQWRQGLRDRIPVFLFLFPLSFRFSLAKKNCKSTKESMKRRDAREQRRSGEMKEEKKKKKNRQAVQEGDYEKWFSSFQRRLNCQRRIRNDMERKIWFEMNIYI